MPARPIPSRRSKPGESQLTSQQVARIQSFLESLVERGSVTVTTIKSFDQSGNTISEETRRRRTNVRPAELKSWRRLLCQLAQSGLLPDENDPLWYPEETAQEFIDLLPWERQIMAKLKSCTELPGPTGVQITAYDHLYK